MTFNRTRTGGGKTPRKGVRQLWKQGKRTPIQKKISLNWLSLSGSAALTSRRNNAIACPGKLGKAGLSELVVKRLVGHRMRSTHLHAVVSPRQVNRLDVSSRGRTSRCRSQNLVFLAKSAIQFSFKSCFSFSVAWMMVIGSAWCVGFFWRLNQVTPRAIFPFFSIPSC